jgi:PAS domain S-box-containing protein
VNTRGEAVPPTVNDESDNSLQTLQADQQFILYRGQRGGARVLIRALVKPEPPGRISPLEHEWSLAADLSSSWAVIPVDLTRDDAARPLLILEDPGGEPLSALIGGTPVSIGRFLRLGIGLATALKWVHSKGLIHQNIRPASVWVNGATGSVRITGFGVASRTRHELQPRPAPELGAGMLPYMAPEQTGRMGRPIDSRTDLYAVGVTLYETLTATLPWCAADPLEWVYCHLAREPIPPIERRPNIPTPLSAILLKLLAKAPEHRYQTAVGLIHDLALCLHEWEDTGKINPFVLGTRDVRCTLQFPEQLYGREREVAALEDAVQRVANNGTPEFVLLSGPAGIGKSSLVAQLRARLEHDRGVFAAGKCDQYNHDVPYAPLAQALQSLTDRLLGRPEAQVRQWRQALVEAVGLRGQVLVNLVPQLELLIGKQPPLGDLPPQETLALFQTLTRRLLQVCARAGEPLVLFLDDLQWVDRETAGMIEHLACSPDSRNLLLICAFRDGELAPGDPLQQILSVLRARAGRTLEIRLSPLTHTEVARLFCESARCSSSAAQSLATIVYEKTGGNPFFTVHFLRELWQEDLLRFDHERGEWTWDLQAIRAKDYTDNVIDLMAAGLHRLPAPTQDALTQLACLGSTVEASTLALLDGEELASTKAQLESAVRAGYLVQRDNAYRFAHDRIREAAYSLVPQAQRPAMHLRIGRALTARMPSERFEPEIFGIVSQLNRGMDLITEPAEREQLARYNLRAGLRAKSNTGYASALDYFGAGIQLLAEDCWNEQYELAFALYLSTAECEYVTGACEAARDRLLHISTRATSIGDRCKVTRVRADVYQTLNQGDRAIEICLEFLRSAGIDWSPRPAQQTIAQELDRIRTQIAERPIRELLRLAPMSEPRALATMKVLEVLAAAAAPSDQNLFALVAGRMVNLTLTHGLSASSSFGYVSLGLVLVTRFRDYGRALEFGEFGLELAQRAGQEHLRARVFMTFAGGISHWSRPFATALPWMRESFELASSHGDVLFATYASNLLSTYGLLCADPLAEVEREIETSLAVARTARFGFMAHFTAAKRGLVRSLRGLTRELGCFDHADFEERVFEEQVCADPLLTSVTCWYWVYKLRARYLAGDYTGALAAAAKAQPLLWATSSLPDLTEYHFYCALAHAADHDEASDEQRLADQEALRAHQTLLTDWARHCPENFRDRELLVAAEQARIRGQDADAIRSYEAAARVAREHGFTYNEALAHELAGRLCLKLRFQTAGYAHLRRALAAYARWGAAGKVSQLQRLYPAPGVSEDAPLATSDSSPVQQVDLMSVIRASQALSSAVTSPEVISSLMRIALENAGADRGLLVMRRGETPRIEARAQLCDQAIEVSLCDAPAAFPTCPETLLRYVIRTRNAMIVPDATEPHPLCDAAYEGRPKSIMCIPLIKQSRLSGLLYLENNLTPHAFTSDRVALLELIAGQAAISLESTRLYTELQEREVRIRRLVDSNIIGVMFWDMDGRIRDANDAFLALVGYTRQELSSGAIDWRNLRAPEYHDVDAAALRELQHNGTHPPVEREYVRKDGRRIPVLVGDALLHGSRDYGVSFVLDLSERRKAESERQAREVAEAANRAKGQFLATMSHELRTPLNSILGYAQILERDRSLDQRQRSAVKVMQHSGQQLLKLINDLLDLAKIESGRFELTVMEVSLPELLRRVTDVIGVSAAAKGVELECDCDWNRVPTRIRADETCLRRVLLNLLSNAVKFTDSGTVTLQVRFCQPAKLRFAVQDTGIGVRPEDLASIFQPFRQVSDLARRAAGSGLGLAISRQLVRCMGGDLRVESSFGEGSTFWFELEGASQARTPEPDVVAEPPVVTGYLGPRRTVLVVDDIAANRAMLTDWLETLGFRTLEAANGAQALAACAQHPDLIVMDLVMPEVDGLQAISALRRKPGTGSLPIIATSASVAKEDARASQVAGADAFLPKPIDLVQLQTLLGTLLDLTWETRRQTPAPPEDGRAEV